MDLKIGVTYSVREIELELASDTDRDELKARIADALGDASAVLWITDSRGREVAVPSSKVAYVDLAGPDSERRIGFG